jgi:hypothetical protein
MLRELILGQQRSDTTGWTLLRERRAGVRALFGIDGG